MKLLLVSRMSKVDHQNKVLPIRVIEKKTTKSNLDVTFLNLDAFCHLVVREKTTSFNISI